MAITKINGVAWESIAKYVGIAKASIEKIAGESKPSVGPTCDVVYYGYSDGRRTPPEDSCRVTPQEYAFDPVTGILYIAGSCGVDVAPAGYYSDGKEISYFDGTSLSYYSACGK